MIACDKCGKVWPLVEFWPIHCTCRNRVGLDRVGENKQPERKPRPVRQPRPIEFPCAHRGEVIRKLDCGCAGNSRVFVCSVFGECQIRKLKPGLGPDQTCNFCESRDDG